jgi:carboxymethylenebutenolidase
MGEMITLTADDGHRLGAYRAAPQGAPRGGVVVIQEIFGVNGHIKRVTDGFAADGYLALAPALFDRVEPGFATGYAPQDVERGRAVRAKIGFDTLVIDTAAAVAALARPGAATAPVGKIGVVGYCLGGSLAWLAATRIPGLACAVGYYGGAVAEHAGERPRCPVLLHFGETDHAIPPDHWATIRAAHPTVPLHVYPAGHGFNCDERGSYHEPSARLARERTLAFLRQHLG